MNSNIILVTGGARSGKSALAEEFATKQGRVIGYVATAQAYDIEMKERIRLHQIRRPKEWKTYEAPYAGAEIIKQAAKEGVEGILFDCLTLYITNLLLRAEQEGGNRTERQRYCLNGVENLLQSAEEVRLPIVFVTNEIGWGIVPDNALAREFRDIAGWANQLVAQKAERVYLVVSGIPVNIKNLQYN